MPKVLRGMKDLFPEETAVWQKMEAASKEIFRLFNYREMRTPVLEETGLFVKSIGEGTDIVTKEMFSFEDRGGRNISLRPEGTAPIVRAYIEAKIYKTAPFQKFYYISPMFRAERPQAGRMRQFHQIGAEAIGSLDPALDAECIVLAAKVLDACGVKDYRIRLNNLGCAEDKKRLSKTLKEALSEKKALLCGDCKARLKANPLRTLDCKQDSCKDVIRAAVKSVRFLCEGCARHFDGVTRHLDILKVPYSLDPYIVRGLDYYTRTVFEASHATLGKGQDAIGAGGRYDNLISDMGGPSLGATGFALGVERMLIAAGASSGAPDEARDRGVYIAAIGAGAHEKGFEITNDLRSKGIACDMDYEGKSLKAQMRSADKSGAKFVVIIGDEELKSGEATLRDMRTKEQSKVKLETLAERIRGK